MFRRVSGNGSAYGVCSVVLLCYVSLRDQDIEHTYIFRCVSMNVSVCGIRGNGRCGLGDQDVEHTYILRCVSIM